MSTARRDYNLIENGEDLSGGEHHVGYVLATEVPSDDGVPENLQWGQRGRVGAGLCVATGRGDIEGVVFW